ncbi:MAG: hypothetical protein L6Q99_05965 [Planctomycetes bacterium]|nr:hypothetical protein [Planctomycetota bacterium]
MKHSFATNVGAAIVLLVPAVALQGGDAKSLGDSLQKTVAVLDELAGIEKRLAEKDPSAVQDLLRVTEPPFGTDAERDQRRDELRDEIQRLQGRHDVLRAPGAEPLVVGVLDEEPAKPRGGASAPSAKPARNERPAGTRKSGDTHAPSAFETHGYVADPLKLVRAYFKQARYGEALAVLDEASADASSNYWRGRCLEKLARRDEALVAYRAARDAKDGGADAARAKEALEFLEWQMRFEAKRTEVTKP